MPVLLTLLSHLPAVRRNVLTRHHRSNRACMEVAQSGADRLQAGGRGGVRWQSVAAV